MTLDHAPDPRLAPDHAHDRQGGLLYDPRCFWCRQVTAQPAPGVLLGWLEAGLDRVAGTEAGR